MNHLAALDIGGANLKAVSSDGRAWCWPFPMTNRPGHLTNRLKLLLQAIGPIRELRLTMTAELCDCFPTKRHGIHFILDAVEAAAPNLPVLVWQTNSTLVDLTRARQHPLPCAAANWLALAWHAAAHLRNQQQNHQTDHPHPLDLLIDTGSTTTDIIPLRNGRPQPKGWTDTQRLATGELVYLGARRTPLMALGPTLRWRGQRLTLMNEMFATTDDVHRLTGDLPQDDSDAPADTPDGQPRTPQHAAARLLRMIGADVETLGQNAATSLAKVFAQRLTNRLARSIRQLVGEHPPNHVVVSGSGDFVAHRAAQAALPSAQLLRWSEIVGQPASQAACAHALLNIEKWVPPAVLEGATP